MAHSVKNKVEAAYRRGDMLDRRRAMMEDWDRFLNSKCTQKEHSMSDKKQNQMAEVNRLYQGQFPTYPKSFVKMAWKSFDFDAVMDVLLDERPSFPHHKSEVPLDL